VSIDSEKMLDLLETNGARLHALLTRLTLREDVAEDLMQELFMNLSQSNAFGRAGDPVAYAYRAAAHLAFRWRRRQRSVPEAFHEAMGLAANAESPLTKVIREEEFHRVLNALDQLSEASRNVVVMRYLRQEPYQKIAEELGKTPHQVRGLCAKAITRLRAILNGNRNSLPGRETCREEL